MQPANSASRNSWFKTELPKITGKVLEVATLITKIAVACFLYWMNPTLFAVGFVLGMIFPEKMEKTIHKIKEIWNRQPISMMVLLGTAAVLSLPVFMATASVLMGGYAGYKLAKEDAKQSTWDAPV